MHCTEWLALASYRSRPAGVTWGYTPCSRERNGNKRISSARTELMTSFGSRPVAMFTDRWIMATIITFWIMNMNSDEWSQISIYWHLQLGYIVYIIRQEIMSVRGRNLTSCYSIRISLRTVEGSCQTLIIAITLKG